MSKGYWLAIYKSIHDADRLAAYAKKASVAIAEGGGTFLSRGMPVRMMEGNEATRTVLIEFESVDAAIATALPHVRNATQDRRAARSLSLGH